MHWIAEIVFRGLFSISAYIGLFLIVHALYEDDRTNWWFAESLPWWSGFRLFNTHSHLSTGGMLTAALVGNCPSARWWDPSTVSVVNIFLFISIYLLFCSGTRASYSTALISLRLVGARIYARSSFSQQALGITAWVKCSSHWAIPLSQKHTTIFPYVKRTILLYTLPVKLRINQFRALTPAMATVLKFLNLNSQHSIVIHISA